MLSLVHPIVVAASILSVHFLLYRLPINIASCTDDIGMPYSSFAMSDAKIGTARRTIKIQEITQSTMAAPVLAALCSNAAIAPDNSRNIAKILFIINSNRPNHPRMCSVENAQAMKLDNEYGQDINCSIRRQ